MALTTKDHMSWDRDWPTDRVPWIPDIWALRRPRKRRSCDPFGRWSFELGRCRTEVVAGQASVAIRARAGGGPDATYVVNSAGGGLRKIAVDTSYPDWSPVGQTIAFAKGYRELRVVSATGGSSKAIARGDARDIDW